MQNFVLTLFTHNFFLGCKASNPNMAIGIKYLPCTPLIILFCTGVQDMYIPVNNPNIDILKIAIKRIFSRLFNISL